MSGPANRGKDAEAEVQDMLRGMSSRSKLFSFERHYDAHSAGGRFQKVTGDFGWYFPGKAGMSYNGVIEVKETQHDSRLPYKNFQSGAVGKLLIREWSGGIVEVYVYHAKADVWRKVPLSHFRERNEDTPRGSWDLAGFPTFKTCAEASADTWELIGAKP